MFMTESFISRNQEQCLCQCHFPKTLCCSIDCCCPCFCFLHESSPNLKSKFNHINESQPLLIPKKEKELFLKSEKDIQKKSPITPIKIKVPRYFNKLNYHYPHHSENFIKSPIINDNNQNNTIKPKNESTHKIIKNISINNINYDDYYNYKKIKVNKKKKDRATTCPVPDQPKKIPKKIDMNNCIPINHNTKVKGKYINNYEINKKKLKKNNEIIFINKKTIDNMKYNHKKLNLTNNYEENKKKFNTLFTNKLKMGDISDDILENKQNYSTLETNENTLILQNLKNEIEKYKKIIKNLKIENEKLKYKLLVEKEKQKNYINNKIKIDKSTNTLNYNNENDIDKDKEKEKEKGKQYIIQKALFEKEINNLKGEISEITFKLNEYENFISILKKRNNDQEKIIKNKDKEISKMMVKLENLEKENNIKLNEINIKKIEIIKEKENISNDYKKDNDNLRKEIIKLNEIILNKDKTIKELEIRNKYEKKYDSKKQEILELLFTFYINVKKIINYDKVKESLRDLIEIIDINDFEYKLNRIEKKIKQVIDDIQIKYGHCFACDIACCTSHVDKLKTFRKNITTKNNL